MSRLDDCLEVIEDLKDFHPLTIKQVHYRLVTLLKCENTIGVYNHTDRILTNARYAGIIPWDVFEDKTRYFRHPGWLTGEGFVSDWLGWSKDYRRDLNQGQPNYVEVWVEKNALYTPFERAVKGLGLPLLVMRGFNSATHINLFTERLERRAGDHEKAIVSFWTDHDPSGMVMREKIVKRLNEKGVCMDVNIVREGLTLEQVDDYELVSHMRAIKINRPGKKDDYFAAGYIEKYGLKAWELDALHPNDLISEVKQAVTRWLDMEKLDAEIEKQEGDRSRITGWVSSLPKFGG